MRKFAIVKDEFIMYNQKKEDIKIPVKIICENIMNFRGKGIEVR